MGSGPSDRPGSRRAAHRARALLLAAVAAVCALACGPALPAGAPVVHALSYDGQAQQNPLVLLFSLQFEDADGDLGDGTLRPLVNGRPTEEEPLAMLDLLLTAGLALNAAAGTVTFELEVEMDLDPATRPKEGSTFTVGTELTDAAGHQSNRPSVTLRIDYP